jgi:hypothetical protein
MAAKVTQAEGRMIKIALVRPIGILVLIIGILLVILPFANVPRSVSEAYQVQKTSTVMDHTFVVLPSNITRYNEYLMVGDLLNIRVTVTSSGNEGIDFSIDYGWRERPELSYSRITTVDRNWTVPMSMYYNFVCDNSFDSLSSKDVTAKVIKYQTETAYRHVTQIGPLLPFEFAYIGLIVALAGVGLVFLVRIESPRRPHIIR